MDSRAKKRMEEEENKIDLSLLKDGNEDTIYRGRGILATKSRTYLSCEEVYPSSAGILPVFSVTTTWYRDTFVPQMAQQYLNGGQVKDIERLMGVPIKEYGQLCRILADNPGTIIPFSQILDAAKKDPQHSRIEIHSMPKGRKQAKQKEMER